MALHIRILAGRLDRTAGSHVYHRELACRLASRGCRVSLVCFEAIPEVFCCADVFEIPQIAYKNKKFFWRFSTLLQYKHCTRKLLKMELSSADIVIGGEHLFLKAHKRMYPRTPFVYLPHSLVVSQEVEFYKLPFLMHQVSTRTYCHLQRWALNHADRTVRFTQKACEALTNYYGNSVRPRFIVNPIGFDLSQLSERKTITDEVRLLWVGGLRPIKGIDFALSALKDLQQYRWKFDIVGDGVLRKVLEQQVKELKLADRVYFHGFQPNPAKWYSQADLLLFPSKSESLGFVMLEAMSFGIPCLAIKADGINYRNVNEEVIDHGQTGILADGEADFRRQLESVLRQPDQLIPLGQAARRHIAEHHTWDKHLYRYEQLFDELLSEKSCGKAISRSGQDDNFLQRAL